MGDFYKKYELWVTTVLIIIGYLFIAYQLIDLVYIFLKLNVYSFQESKFFPNIGDEKVGVRFFDILLTLEIIETVKVIAKDHKVKIKIILLVGLIAVTRKILLLDAFHAEPLIEFATAAMIVALAIAYHLICHKKVCD